MDKLGVVTSFIHFVVLAIYTIIALLLAPALFNECITGWNIPVLIGGLLLRLVIFFAINSLILNTMLNKIYTNI